MADDQESWKTVRKVADGKAGWLTVRKAGIESGRLADGQEGCRR